MNRVDVGFEWIVNKLWVLLAGWFWYDKRDKDARLKELEKTTGEQDSEIKVLQTKLDGVKELIEVKFDNINNNMNDLKSLIERRNNDGA